jgi:hypothetical protein
MGEYDRASDTWFHLSNADQLTVNHEKFKEVNELICKCNELICKCIDIVESIQHDIGVSGN